MTQPADIYENRDYLEDKIKKIKEGIEAIKLLCDKLLKEK